MQHLLKKPMQVEIVDEPVVMRWLTSTSTAIGGLDKDRHTYTRFVRQKLTSTLRDILGPGWEAMGPWTVEEYDDGLIISGLGGYYEIQSRGYLYTQIAEDVEDRSEVSNYWLDLEHLGAWLRKEAQLAKLLYELGIEPIEWPGGYRIGRLVIDERGYIVDGERMSIDEALDRLLEEEEE